MKIISPMLMKYPILIAGTEYMGVIEKALLFASAAHEGQTRKMNGLPFILHPMEAAVIVSEMCTDEDVIAAALLHDAVEDTSVTLDDVRKEFGTRICRLVEKESENKRNGLPRSSTWCIRKQESVEKIRTASPEAKMIALADKLSNMRSIYHEYQLHGDEVFNKFNMKDKEMHCWYYCSMAENLREFSSSCAWQELADLILKVFGKDIRQEAVSLHDNQI